jgi:uncharacterized short protein YbdD (DUF466 family)
MCGSRCRTASRFRFEFFPRRAERNGCLPAGFPDFDREIKQSYETNPSCCSRSYVYFFSERRNMVCLPGLSPR